MQICWIGTDLSDLAASTCAFPTSPCPHPTHFQRHQSVLFQSSKLSFAILSKGTFNSSNYRGGGGSCRRVRKQADLKRGGLAEDFATHQGFFTEEWFAGAAAEAACAGSSMENYPLYGKASAALSSKYDEERHKNIGLFLFLFFLTEKNASTPPYF